MMDDDVAKKVRAFFEHYPERHFMRRQMLVHAGEEPSGVFYVLEGRVNQYDISPAGTEVVVNIFKPPAFFPVAWAMNRTPNGYFFEAATDVVTRVAPADDVVAFLQREPGVVFDLLARVYRGTDGVLRRLAHLMGGDARSRLLFELLKAAHRFGEAGPDGAVYLPLKEGDIAKQSGLARETVNRLIKNLKAEGLIIVQGSGLLIPDTRKLEAALGADL
jgi:CRP-like cAMP-binding protein